MTAENCLGEEALQSPLDGRQSVPKPSSDKRIALSFLVRSELRRTDRRSPYALKQALRRYVDGLARGDTRRRPGVQPTGRKQHVRHRLDAVRLGKARHEVALACPAASDDEHETRTRIGRGADEVRPVSLRYAGIGPNRSRRGRGAPTRGRGRERRRASAQRAAQVPPGLLTA